MSGFRRSGSAPSWQLFKGEHVIGESLARSRCVSARRFQSEDSVNCA